MRDADLVQSLLRELGNEVRRRRNELGLPQKAVAARASCARESITQIETARQYASPSLMASIDKALQAGGALLVMHRQLDELRRVARASAPADPSPGEGLEVDRRQLIRKAGVLAAAAMMPPLRAQVVAPWAGDIAPIEHFRQVRRVLIDADNLFGPARVIPTVHEQIQVLQQVRSGASGTDGRGLLHMQTQFAEFAGWLHQDQGDHGKAQYWTDRALEWSYATHDPDLTTFILARKGQLAGDMQDAVTAVDVSEAAAGMAAPGTRLAAIATTYAAHGYALAGDGAASAGSYDQAQKLLADGSGLARSPWGVWLDASYIEVQRARSLVVLGSYTAAAEGFQRAVDELPEGYQRDRGVYLARAALAHAGARDAEQAAAFGMRALAIGAQTGSGRITSELRQLDSIFDTWGAPAGHEFRDAMRSTSPSGRTS